MQSGNPLSAWAMAGAALSFCMASWSVSEALADTVNSSASGSSSESSAISSDSSADVSDRMVVEGKKYLSISESQSVKTPTPILDVPQSLTIIGADDIIARGFDGIGQIIDYTPGVNNSQGEGHRDAVVFRGVRSTADFFIDGNRDDVQYYRALYNIEKVEILRGPNALLFGRGGTGGILNRVSKKADLDEAFNAYTASMDSFGGAMGTIDTNIVTGENSAFRLNAMAQTLEAERDFYYGDRYGLNPTFRYAVSEVTTLDLSYEFIQHERFIDRGIPTAFGRPVEALKDIVFADPDDNYHELTAHVFRANVEHFFTDSIKGHVNVFYGDYDKVYANYYATDYDPVTNIVELDGYIDETIRDNLILSGNLVSEFETGGVAHTVLLGTEFIRTHSDQLRFNPVFSTSGSDREDFLSTRPLDFRAGRGTNAAGEPFTVGFDAFNDDTRVKLDVFSFYLQDEIRLSEHFNVVLGARFDQFDIEVFNADPDVLETRTRKDSEITPRGGLIYKPRDNVSLYLSYSESFLPRSGEQYMDINGPNDALDPDTFSNREVGVKWDFSPSLSFTAALFKNKQSSPQVADLDPQTLDVIDSEIDGFELQLSGQITSQWFVSANYSRLNGEIVERTGPTGRTPAELPKNMFSVWTSYDINDSFGVGFGAMYQGRSFINTSNSAFLPSYTRFDAAAYYQVSDALRLQLNIENLTDKLYFPTAHATHQASVGLPRHAMLSLVGSF